jgi:hypothetical protein
MWFYRPALWRILKIDMAAPGRLAQKAIYSTPHNATPTDNMAGNISEEEAAKAIEDLFTAVVNGDTAAAEALEDMHRRTVGHRPLDDNVMSRFAEFKKEQRERWKYKFVYDDPKFPGTDERVLGWMLTQDNIPDDVEAMYPGIRAVQARLGKHKFHPLPAEASEGESGFDDYMAACTIRFVGLFDRMPHA